MPALRIMKNQKHFCTVGSDDVWMFSASVWGDIWGPETSLLDVSGGGKPRGEGESDFLIWGLPCELTKSDCIEFFFEEGAASSPKGRVFDPADFPREDPKFEISSPPTDEDVAKLAARPALNESLSWSFSLDGAVAFDLAPDAERQYIRLSVLWNDHHPQRLRLSIAKKSLREIVSRMDGEKMLSEYVPMGSSFCITVR